MKLRLGWMVVAMLSAVGGWAQTTWYVAPDGLESHGGAGWTDAFRSISNAVARAQDGDTVLVSNGLYETAAQIAVTNAVLVRSWNQGALDRTGTVVRRSGAAVHRVFYINKAGATVAGFTITNGVTVNSSQFTRSGAGVFIDTQGGTLTNCLVTGNAATNNGYGGGVFCVTGTVANCVIRDNRSHYYGGGVAGSNALIRACRIENNTALGHGGGVCAYFANTNLVVRDSFICNNTASGGNGGGIYVYTTARILVDACVITGNVATLSDSDLRGGGGLYLNGAAGIEQWVRNSLIQGNTAARHGGGAFLYQWGQVDNCTIADNAAATNGGGIYVFSGNNVTGVVRNTIVYYNTAGLLGPDWFFKDSAGSWNFTNNCLGSLVAANRGGGNFTNEPAFVERATGNYRLQPQSPCLNAGTNQAWMADARDLDGTPRVARTIVDVGAYEVAAASGTLLLIR